MAVCLDYQNVYSPRREFVASLKLQILGAVVLLIALCFKVWVKVESTDLGYQLAQERESAIELDMQLRELRLQHSVLMRPDNLSLRAKEVLGLGPMNPSQARRIMVPESKEEL